MTVPAPALEAQVVVAPAVADNLFFKNKELIMKRKASIFIFASLLLSIFLAIPTNTVTAKPLQQTSSHWCGNGSEADDFGFSYELNQPHWTVGNGLVSEQTMIDVDVILDKLNADQLAQTMILVLPADQVGAPVNCAVHFLRYMDLGLMEGPHADNGFSWLFVVGENKVDVYYGVGLGLNGLTAQNIGPLKRLGADTFAETKSVDKAVLETVKEYDAYVRSEYPVSTPVPTRVAVVQNVQNTTPQSNNGASGFLIIVLCLVGLGVLGLVFFLLFFGRGSSSSSSSSYTPDYTPDPPSYDRPSQSHHDSTPSYSPPPSFSRPSSSNSSWSSPSRPSSSPSSSPSRGGSGSGRSGRGG